MFICLNTKWSIILSLNKLFKVNFHALPNPFTLNIAGNNSQCGIVTTYYFHQFLTSTWVKSQYEGMLSLGTYKRKCKIEIIKEE